MIVERHRYRCSRRGREERSTYSRTVEISGADVARFANLLLEQAHEARAAGKESEAVRKERCAAAVRLAKKVSVAVPAKRTGGAA